LHLGQASVIYYLFFRAALASACKHISFKEEAEWRLIYILPQLGQVKFRKGLSSLIPYVEIPLGESHTEGRRKAATFDSVTIGPTPDMVLAKSSLERFIQAKGKNTISVMASKIPFRSW
jgi:hypothetical protein